jgi:hypothetical protein
LDTSNELVKFTFTAPGDDGELGLASEYEILSSYDMNYLIDNHHDFEHENPEKQNKSLPVNIVSSSFDRNTTNKPNQGGFEEHFVLKTSEYKDYKTFSIKIRAVDAAGNYGKWSWPLTVKLSDDIELSPQLRHVSSHESPKHLLPNEAKTTISGKQKSVSKFFIGFISNFQ